MGNKEESTADLLGVAPERQEAIFKGLDAISKKMVDGMINSGGEIFLEQALLDGKKLARNVSEAIFVGANIIRVAQEISKISHSHFKKSVSKIDAVVRRMEDSLGKDRVHLN